MKETKEEKILLFIPCYNCEKQIPRVLASLENPDVSFISHVLIVNNRSTDKTLDSIKGAVQKHKMKNTTVLNNDANYGLGGSHKVAFKFAIENNFDFIIVLHGDDQGQLKDIAPLISNRSYHQKDCLLGARFHPRSKLVGYSKFRTFGNMVFNFFFSMALGTRIYDLGSGLNCYKVSILKDQFFYSFPDNLSFNYTMILAHSYYKHSTIFFPISWQESDQISNVKLTSQALNLLKLLGIFLIKRHKFIQSDFRSKVSNYSSTVAFSS